MNIIRFVLVCGCVQGSRKSSVSAVRTLTPASLSGLRFSFDAHGKLHNNITLFFVFLTIIIIIFTVERSSNTWRDTGPVSPPPLAEPFPVPQGQPDEQFIGQGLFVGQQHEQNPDMGQHSTLQDPFMGQQDDDEHSELSFSSAFGTPSVNVRSFDHHRETAV